VFPDGELHEVGKVVSAVQAAGFEVRDLENLREHYALTLRRWIANLEAHSNEAVALVGEGRYRVWRLYMAGSARNFETGVSGLPLRRGYAVLPETAATATRTPPLERPRRSGSLAHLSACVRFALR